MALDKYDCLPLGSLRALEGIGSSPNPKVRVRGRSSDRKLYLWEPLELESSLVGFVRGSKVMVETKFSAEGVVDTTGQLMKLNLYASIPNPKTTNDGNAISIFIKFLEEGGEEFRVPRNSLGPFDRERVT